ncbi:MAG: metallophosphoesterase [Aigarchaeota archaeon]|nr:metallophosphoesterase [Aigarchaeota archaeon]MDW8021801.1 metallophosphoesterase [Nitrososphaerota archaeon]
MLGISRRALLLIMGCVIGVVAIPSWTETLRIEVTRLKLDLGLKLAFLVDTHLHFLGPVEENLLKIISREDPDVILHGGDVIDEFTGNLDLVRRYFSSLDARRKYAVLGNHDYWSGNASELIGIMRRECGFHFLIDDVVEFSGLRIFGVDWRDDRRYPRIGGTDIVLAHDPNVAPCVNSAKLILAGHTHGGIVVSGVTIFSNSIYSRGLYHLQNQGILYVSRGLGQILPFRPTSPLELVIIE